MAVAIKEMFIAGYDGYPMAPKYITIHNTANESKGANAEMHARYLNNGAGGRTVSWHYTVDDHEIIQHLPTNVNGWHAGDGANGPGNRQSIGIEICENVDGDFEKAVANAIELVQYLMRKHNIGIMNVVPHQRWSGKYCPRKLLTRWDALIKRIADTNVKSAVASKPSKAPAKPAEKPTAKPASAPSTPTGQTLSLPASESSWRVYPVGKAPTKGNESGFLNPKKFGGLTYDILDNPAPDVYTIKTGDFGTVNIYAGKETGAKVSGKAAAKAKPKQYVQLPKSASSWRAYPLSKAPTKGNEIASLNPAKFGGLEYEVLRFSQPDVAVVKTQQFGEVQIYVAASTGAKLVTK